MKFGQGVNVIWGNNGSGKTSVLEAIHSLSMGKSFKTNRHKELLKTGESFLSISGIFTTNDSVEKIVLNQTKKGERRFLINESPLLGLKELVGKNPIIVLSPEEQTITKGAPSSRRQFFDKLFSVISKPYIEILMNYHRLLKQRNAALIQIKEEKESENNIEIWDNPIAREGANLWLKRSELLEEYKKELFTVVEQFSENEKVSIEYRAKEIEEEPILNQLRKNRHRDIITGQTHYGPHRDDYSIYWNNSELKKYGSQGEHKISLVLLKLAELFFTSKRLNQTPILLLDDLFAKLDSGRSKKVVDLIKQFEKTYGEKIQTIITTTDLINLDKSGIQVDTPDVTTFHLETICNA